MTTRIRIFAKDGAALAELNASCTRSWILNDVGRGTISLAVADDKCCREYLEFGNLVYVEHDKLPAWGGVIDTPRTWSGNTVEISIYSAETILNWRRGWEKEKLTGTPGELYRQIIIKANQEGDTRITLGEIYTGGVSKGMTFTLSNLFDAVKKVSDESGMDWGLDPALDPQGRLYFIANWYERRGMARILRLVEGLNVAKGSNPLTEQGTIANDITGFGNHVAAYGGTIIENVRDEASQSRYGLRQLAKSVDGDNPAAVRDAANSELAANKNPRRTMRLEAADVGECFYNLRLGDVLPVNMQQVGFGSAGLGMEGFFRVVGMDFSEASAVCKLVLDEDE